MSWRDTSVGPPPAAGARAAGRRAVSATAMSGPTERRNGARARTFVLFVAALALVALLFNATLSVFKPWGLTAYGKRRQEQRRGAAPVDASSEIDSAEARPTPRWVLVVGIHAIGLAVLAVVMHLAGDGAGHH